jgi:hypothetical protein
MKKNIVPVSNTCIHETELKLKEAISLSEVSSVLIQLVQQFESKVELHVHFNINSIVGNHLTGSNIQHGNNNTAAVGTQNTVTGIGRDNNAAIQQIGHRTTGNSSQIDGAINGALGFSEFQKQIAENNKRIEKQIEKKEKRIKEHLDIEKKVVSLQLKENRAH